MKWCGEDIPGLICCRFPGIQVTPGEPGTVPATGTFSPGQGKPSGKIPAMFLRKTPGSVRSPSLMHGTVE